MNLQIIKSIDGRAEYVLLPFTVYKALHNVIEEKLVAIEKQDDLTLFDPADYVDNPIALARITAGLTQRELAKRMKLSQAYLSKVERQNKVSPKLLLKVKEALKNNTEAELDD